MFENLFNSPILQNPMFIAAILAVIRNLGGYIYNCFEAKKILPYSGSQFLVTLGLWETVFVVLAGGANLNSETTAVIAIALDWIRGLKTAISGTTTSTSQAATLKVTYSPWIQISADTWQRYVYTPNQATTIETVHTNPNPQTPVVTYSAWTQGQDIFNKQTVWVRNVLHNGVFFSQEYSSTDPAVKITPLQPPTS